MRFLSLVKEIMNCGERNLVNREAYWGFRVKKKATTYNAHTEVSGTEKCNLHKYTHVEIIFYNM